MKRILLFLATNLAVVVLLGVILRLIGGSSKDDVCYVSDFVPTL